MIEDFKSYANLASSFHKDDVSANAVFIKSKLDKKYGTAGKYFFIMIQTQSVEGTGMIMTDQHVWAQINGINLIYPQWSYFFFKSAGTSALEDYNIISYPNKSQGIAKYLDMINEAVNDN